MAEKCKSRFTSGSATHLDFSPSGDVPNSVRVHLTVKDGASAKPDFGNPADS